VFWEEEMSREDPGVPERWARDATRCHEGLLERLRAQGFE
jgi:hypothetical protein